MFFIRPGHTPAELHHEVVGSDVAQTRCRGPSHKHMIAGRGRRGRRKQRIPEEIRTPIRQVFGTAWPDARRSATRRGRPPRRGRTGERSAEGRSLPHQWRSGPAASPTREPWRGQPELAPRFGPAQIRPGPRGRGAAVDPAAVVQSMPSPSDTNAMPRACTPPRTSRVLDGEGYLGRGDPGSPRRRRKEKEGDERTTSTADLASLDRRCGQPTDSPIQPLGMAPYTLAAPMDCILNLCTLRGWPALTVLVVKAKTGRPGVGCL